MKVTSTERGVFLPSSFQIWRRGGKIYARVESESLPGHFYFVSAYPNGWAECNCPAWKKWGNCKHSTWVLEIAPRIEEVVREVEKVLEVIL